MAKKGKKNYGQCKEDFRGEAVHRSEGSIYLLLKDRRR